MPLATPPAARIVPDGVFDAFGWCRSDVLEWRRPARAWDASTPIDGSNPARMAFVMHAHARERDRARLPRELARLHAHGLGLVDEDALAPWAIDDATDELHAHGIRPRDLFWLAADNLNALFWGLHDWAHFHNHGPFAQVAWTELQCDASALAWLWRNRDRIPMDAATWEGVRRDIEALSRERFAAEGRELPAGALAAERVQGLIWPRIARSYTHDGSTRARPVAITSGNGNATTAGARSRRRTM